MSQSISVCIITKNEEKYISDCIKSVINIVNEIIVVDTGSTDKTIEICESFNKVKVYQTQWENNFSKARNIAISNATQDWILILDADERLSEDTQKQLNNFLSKIHDDNSIFRFKTENKFVYHISSYYKATLFKNNQGVTYIKHVHEYPYIPDNKIKIINCEKLVIEHIEKPDSVNILEKKARKYIDIMLDELKKSKYPDYYYCKHLGDDYLTLGNNELALDYYLKSENLSLLIPDKDLYFYKSILTKIIKLFVSYKKDYKNGLFYSNKLLKIYPDFTEAIFYKGFCHNRLLDYKQAIECHQKLLKNKSNKTLLFNIYIELSRAYRGINNIKQSLNYLNKAKEINPDNYGLKIHYLKHFILENNFIEANKYYFELTKSDFSSTSIINILDFLVKQEGWDNHENKELKDKYKDILRTV